ncbi:MAG: carbon-nitrogen hydrolase family protein [Eubacteriales bacterium]|nr:carbon-nitrogen hydrolase family protein [Eubacteriales bacterium]
MKVSVQVKESSLNDPQFNFEVLASAARQAKANNSELLLFAEAFLQGFEAMSFDYAEDIQKAYSIRGSELAKVRQIARENELAIGLGFYENYKGGIYSAYAIFDQDGETIEHYRRVSPGWKMPKACADYREGSNFHSFRFAGKTFATLICGDFWTDELLPAIIAMDADVDAFIWPVHCDYESEFWQQEEKAEYAKRSAILAKPILFINNFVKEKNRAKGGVYLWQQGKTLAALEMGELGQLNLEL